MEPGQDYLVSKTFVFENENNFAAENLDVPLRYDLEQINIAEIIDIFRHQNAIYEPLAFKIYDPEINHYVALDPTKPISRSWVYSPVVMIKYKEARPPVEYDK